MSVKLPLLGQPARGAGAHGGERARVAAVDPRARARADRRWLAVIGAPGDEAPVRCACALAQALGDLPHSALLAEHAPAAVEQALRDAGCQVERLREPASERAVAHALTAVPADHVVLVVEADLAACARGLLDVWVGAAPGKAPAARGGAAASGALPLELALHGVADVILPPSALGAAAALGAALARRLASAPLRINDHTNAP